ncbi:DUF1810 domain-containing protein [Defluviimonas sp. SAOS-178_SWC]|uniref:DUF1810 domain-containing protein n=1 Tax=Defluviimonas sp. SAOS-178_SWC TaxID=3121287 RepID=UPI00322202DB
MDDLARFRAAQEGVYETALRELQAGRKTSHWMWFIFPQLRGLGRSATAVRYGIADLDEARAYLADPVLGPRLITCAGALLGQENASAETILGPVDALKLRSSATLFRAAGDQRTSRLMQAVLDRFHDGRPCPLTLTLLRDDAPGTTH